MAQPSFNTFLTPRPDRKGSAGFSNDTNDYTNYNSVVSTGSAFTGGVNVTVLDIQSKRGYLTKCLFNINTGLSALRITIDGNIIFNTTAHTSNFLQGLLFEHESFYNTNGASIRLPTTLMTGVGAPGTLSSLPFSGTIGISVLPSPLFFRTSCKIEYNPVTTGTPSFEYQYATN